MGEIINFPKSILVKTTCPCCKIQIEVSLFEHTESIQCPRCEEFLIVNNEFKNKIIDEYLPEGDVS